MTLTTFKWRYARGQNGLGYLYTKGFGVPKDDAKAFYWYRKAADQGDAKGEYNVGNYYGLGVPMDRAEAHRRFQKAAMQGDENARRAITLRPTALGIALTLMRLIIGPLVFNIETRLSLPARRS